MKKLLLAGGLILAAGAAYTQQTQGRVVYERTTQMQMRFSGIGGDEMQQMIPRARTDKMELLFANNQSLRRAIAEETPQEEEQPAGGGMQIRMIIAGSDDISYCNFTTGLITEQREFATKKYIVLDSVRRLPWKLTGESKTILNYTCQKAVTQRIGQRTMMMLENGQANRKVLSDTSNISVWFTGAIPVSAGPDFQGQLPGLILEININNGNIIYKALDFSEKVETNEIKEPKSGKKLSQDEFVQEREKAMEEMQRNRRGRS